MSTIDEYIDSKLGNDTQFKESLFKVYSILKIVNFENIAPELLKLVDEKIYERKQFIANEVFKYFMSNRKNKYGFEKIEYKGEIPISSYDGLHIRKGSTIVAVRGRFIEGTSY